VLDVLYNPILILKKTTWMTECKKAYITLVFQCESEVLLGEDTSQKCYHSLNRRIRTVFEMSLGPGFVSDLCTTMAYAISEMLDNLSPVVGTHTSLC
jgi:hypothetical protein